MKIKIKCPNVEKWKKQNMDFTEVNNDTNVNTAYVITLVAGNSLPDYIKTTTIKYYLENNEFKKI